MHDCRHYRYAEITGDEQSSAAGVAGVLAAASPAP